MNLLIGNFPIGPNGIYGVVTIAFVNGLLVTSVSASFKGVLDEVAKKIGGPVPAEVATFLETAVGLK